MSVAMPAAASKGSTFSIAGRKISWDALLVAGAGVLGVVLLYRAGQPVAGGSATPTDTSGATTLGDLSTQPLDPTQPATIPLIPATGYQSFMPPSTPAVSSAPPPPHVAVTTSAPLNNYSPAYATSVQPPSGAGQPAPAPTHLSTVIQNAFNVLASPAPFQPFNPVVPRSHGTQAV